MILSESDLRDRAGRIRLACFDVDGTLTDGRLIYDGEGRESKAFHVLDGQGIKLLEENGVTVALVTARRNAAVQARARDLGLQHVFAGVKDKGAVLLQLCETLELTPAQATHMGDDLPDLPALLQVGLAAAPANAHPWVAERVHWQSRARGGEGAVRELCDLILDAKGLRQAVLDRFGVA
ncbi:haloacid dehalogenase [Arenimonas soli]|uniref:3-deoxy-D-manno-octulosonate 8-phosphate phosphatase KdsC n=1 Tax=Arenimonas soli TaxID=2269504 RepID=A0ABQ1HRC3_9GAMM|nr:HAD family hydrolase [Arenimonas soli]GGA85624.1 haloacid dehalogenase [Arenimonas soli]